MDRSQPHTDRDNAWQTPAAPPHTNRQTQGN